MFFKSIAFVCLTGLSTSSVLAADWPKANVDAALSIVRNAENGMAECVEHAHAKLAFDVVQKDINDDGINELEITSHVDKLGTGAIACFGGAGQDIYLLLPNGKGGWTSEFGYDAASLEYHSRGKGLLPDVEISGPGFCFPIWRYYHGQYAIWKTCNDDNKLVYAYTVKDTDQKTVVPRDPDELPVGADIDHDTAQSAATAAPSKVASQEAASVSDWSGDYGLDCKSNKVQCAVTFTDLPGHKVSGKFTVADRLDFNKVQCSVTEIFAPQGSAIQADSRSGKISVTHTAGGLKVRGFSPGTCSVSLNGTYSFFGDE